MAAKMTIVAEKSGNEKTGFVVATYAPTRQTCSSACPFKGPGKGCYAIDGCHTGAIDRRLTAAAGTATAETVARAEAAGIDAVHIPRKGGRPIRLHVGGDARTNKAASILAGAIGRYQARGGGRAWSYTHAWRTVRRESWGAVSILASMESATDAPAALARGFAPARIVPSFPNGAKAWTENGVRWIPCPAQTKDDVKCETCRLCWNSDGLAARSAGIAFEAHGPTRKRMLPVIQPALME